MEIVKITTFQDLKNIANEINEIMLSDEGKKKYDSMIENEIDLIDRENREDEERQARREEEGMRAWEEGRAI